MRRERKWLGGLFAVLTPLLLTLSYPKYDLPFLAWIALVPLLLAVVNLKKTDVFIFESLMKQPLVDISSNLGVMDREVFHPEECILACNLYSQ